MMMSFVPLFYITLSFAAGSQVQAAAPPDTGKLHARVREWPYPVNGVTVPDGSPALLWPGTNGRNTILPMESGAEVAPKDDGSNVRYKVMLAADRQFKTNVIAGEEQRWAVYPLHQNLKAGRWFWKYGYTVKGSGKWTWSPVYDFVVKNASAQVSPPLGSVLARNKGPHPRLWNMHANGEVFYRNNLQNPEAKAFLAYAEKLLKEPLPKEEPRRFIDTTGTTDLEKKKLIERMYHGFGDFAGTPVRNLCIAFQLSKDERFIKAAIRRGMHLAQMDPDGLATRDDFTGGAILEALGWLYDAGYAFLGQQEKDQLRRVIKLRALRVYSHLPNRFELHVSDNHVWQITMRNFAIGTVAVMNEVPEATEWLSYLYEVWSARFPILGTTDGGWHEGNGYFRVNFKSFIYLSQLFGDFSGMSYFDLPWMRNLPYYMLYTYPPGATSTATGDMFENLPGMVKMQAWFAEALGIKMNNPYLNWYVSEVKKNNPEFFRGTDDLLLFRLLHYDPSRKLPVASPDKLPKLREFRDVGVVAMHEDLAHAGNSLSSYLLSSPFGSSGHGHAAQNAFTLNYKGKTVFGGSGYYSNFSDKHNLLHYRTSRASCTMLADSLGQKLGEEGYGWIPRAMSGSNIQYALGDASNAYGNTESEFWLDRFRQINLKPDAGNGYGDPGVKLYRRHMLQLAGNYLVLYDELEAAKPVRWTSQFHSPFPIKAGATADAHRQQFTVQQAPGAVNATVFAGTPLAIAVHDRFSAPAVNWAKVTDDEGKIKVFNNQWHAGITSTPMQRFRFLTIIQVKDGQPEVVQVLGNKAGLYRIKIGEWEIQAALDAVTPAALQVSSSASFFNYGALPVRWQGRTYRHHAPGSSLLLELQQGRLNRKEVADTLPDVAKYDAGFRGAAAAR